LMDCNLEKGWFPQGLLRLSGDRLYGMTEYGGDSGYGVVFSIDTNGRGYENLLNFNGANGGNPEGNVTIVGRGLYGMAQYGGLDNDGLIFRLMGVGLGIGNTQLQQYAINVFPNPSYGTFNFYTSLMNTSNVLQTVEIYNSLGEMVYNAPLLKNDKVDLNSHPNGLYLYRVLDEKGTLISTGKLIIQK